MKRPLVFLCTAAVALTLAVSCGGGDDGPADGESTSVDALVAVMVDDGAPRETAECIAEKLEDVTANELFEFFEAVADGEDVVATEGVARLFINARTACDVGA